MVDSTRCSPLPVAQATLNRKLRRVLGRAAAPARPRGRPRRIPTDDELRDTLQGIMDRAVSHGPRASMRLAIAMLDGPPEVMPALAQVVLQRCCARHGWKD